MEQVLLRLIEMSSATSASLYHNDSKEAIRSVSIHPLRTSVFTVQYLLKSIELNPSYCPLQVVDGTADGIQELVSAAPGPWL